MITVHAYTMIIVHACTMISMNYDHSTCMYYDQSTRMYYDHSTCIMSYRAHVPSPLRRGGLGGLCTPREAGGFGRLQAPQWLTPYLGEPPNEARGNGSPELPTDRPNVEGQKAEPSTMESAIGGLAAPHTPLLPWGGKAPPDPLASTARDHELCRT